MRSHRQAWLAFLRRVVAASGAALMLALSILAASPSLHGTLHETDHQEASDAGCIVAQFAGGVAVPAQATAPLPEAAAAERRIDANANDHFGASPRFLHPPERGPPAS